MAATKVTFTFDQTTVAKLQDAATRLSMPKSEVVREPIQEFHDRIGHLSERERLRLLRTFDEVMPRSQFSINLPDILAAVLNTNV